MTYDGSVSDAHSAWRSEPDPRTRWAALLARLTDGFVRGIPADGSPAWSRLPGADPEDRIPGMEGFARMATAWAAWLAGPNPTTLTHAGRTTDVLDVLSRGLVDATTPGGPWWWGAIRDRDQRIVEAAGVASALWMARDRLVPALGEQGTRQVLTWLGQVHGRDVYADNWVLFPVAVAIVARGLGQDVPDALIDRGVDRILAWDRGDGWYSDGDGHAFDRYTGWAIHWHLLEWAHLDGDRRPDVRDRVLASARTWLRDLPAWAAADGAIPLLGRSLGYRFATASPLGLAAVLDELPIDPGMARGIIDRSIGYHLAHDALDPATDWFRIGVWGQRPEVVERYMSAGASAWAVKAFLPLALGPGHPFWTTPDPGLPGTRTDPAAGPGVDLPLQGPGYLVGRRPLDGGVWVASALMDHPDDIPGHDYRPTYGKWLYHTDFPLTEAAADGRPGPDGAVVLEGPAGGIGHRDLVAEGGVGADWTWTRHPLHVDGVSHALTTVSIRISDIWVRATGVRAAGPVRATVGALPLAVEDAATIRRTVDDAMGTASATDGTRWVAIRALHGFHRVVGSGPARGGADRNLVAAHSEQPTLVADLLAGTHLLVHADVARCRDEDPSDTLGGIEVAEVATEQVALALPSGEQAWLAVGIEPPTRVELAGWVAHGPALRALRIGPADAWFAGESIHHIDGVVRLDAPGPLEVRRLPDGGVLVSTQEALVLDPAWAGPQRTIAVHEDGHWVDVGPLETPGEVDPDLLVRLQARTGHRLVWLWLRP